MILKNNDLATFLKAAIAKLFLDNEVCQKISPGSEFTENVEEDQIEGEDDLDQDEAEDNTNFFEPERRS